MEYKNPYNQRFRCVETKIKNHVFTEFWPLMFQRNMTKHCIKKNRIVFVFFWNNFVDLLWNVELIAGHHPVRLCHKLHFWPWTQQNGYQAATASEVEHAAWQAVVCLHAQPANKQHCTFHQCTLTDPSSTGTSRFVSSLRLPLFLVGLVHFAEHGGHPTCRCSDVQATNEAVVEDTREPQMLAGAKNNTDGE